MNDFLRDREASGAMPPSLDRAAERYLRENNIGAPFAGADAVKAVVAELRGA